MKGSDVADPDTTIDVGTASEADRLVAAAIAEDVGAGDWTTLWTVAPEARSEAVVVAREPTVVAGVEVARRVFVAVEPGLRVEAVVRDGREAPIGAAILRVAGSSRSILTAERSALNFLGRLSGIATLTRRFVDEVHGTGARITDTRKTTPGWRRLEKWAVRLGGGVSHRMGLDDMVLVKDNHVAAAGGVGVAARLVLDANERKLPVEVEVGNLAELDELRSLPVDRILLDNMSTSQMADAVQRVGRWPAPRPELEASGNMTLERVREVAETGVRWISVGALTHSARAVDLSLEMGG